MGSSVGTDVTHPVCGPRVSGSGDALGGHQVLCLAGPPSVLRGQNGVVGELGPQGCSGQLVSGKGRGCTGDLPQQLGLLSRAGPASQLQCVQRLGLRRFRPRGRLGRPTPHTWQTRRGGYTCVPSAALLSRPGAPSRKSSGAPARPQVLRSGPQGSPGADQTPVVQEQPPVCHRCEWAGGRPRARCQTGVGSGQGGGTLGGVEAPAGGGRVLSQVPALPTPGLPGFLPRQPQEPLRRPPQTWPLRDEHPHWTQRDCRGERFAGPANLPGSSCPC